MTNDEFKDAGKYFAEGEYVQLPVPDRTSDWTLEGWFIWLSGRGPLIGADEEPWMWGWIYDCDGRCGYRVGGVERQTDTSVTDVRERWIYVAVAKEGSAVTLWINDRAADEWTGAPILATLSDIAAMKHAVGFAADVARYDRRLPDQCLTAHWNAGKSRV